MKKNVLTFWLIPGDEGVYEDKIICSMLLQAIFPSFDMQHDNILTKKFKYGLGPTTN